MKANIVSIILIVCPLAAILTLAFLARRSLARTIATGLIGFIPGVLIAPLLINIWQNVIGVDVMRFYGNPGPDMGGIAIYMLVTAQHAFIFAGIAAFAFRQRHKT